MTATARAEPFFPVERFSSPAEAARAWVMQLRGQPTTTLPGLKRTLLEELLARQQALHDFLTSASEMDPRFLVDADGSGNSTLRVIRRRYTDAAPLGLGASWDVLNQWELMIWVHRALFDDIYGAVGGPLVTIMQIYRSLEQIALPRKGRHPAWKVRSLVFGESTIVRRRVTTTGQHLFVSSAGSSYQTLELLRWPISCLCIPPGRRTPRATGYPSVSEACAAYEALPGGLAELLARKIALLCGKEVTPVESSAYNDAAQRYSQINTQA